MKIWIGKDDNGSLCIFNSEPERRRMANGEHAYMPKDDYADISTITEEDITIIERELPCIEDEKYRNHCWLEGFLEMASELLDANHNADGLVMEGLLAAGVEPHEFNTIDLQDNLRDVVNRYVEQYNGRMKW